MPSHALHRHGVTHVTAPSDSSTGSAPLCFQLVGDTCFGAGDSPEAWGDSHVLLMALWCPRSDTASLYIL